MINILVVDDEPLMRQGLAFMVKQAGISGARVFEAENAEDALMKCTVAEPDIMIVDIKMPGEDGLSLAAKLQDRYGGRIQFIIASAYGEFDFSLRALRLQAVDYLLKPVKEAELHSALRRAVEHIQEFHEGARANPQAQRIVYLSSFLSGESALLPDMGLFAETAADTRFRSVVIRFFGMHGKRRQDIDVLFSCVRRIMPDGSYIAFHKNNSQIVLVFREGISCNAAALSLCRKLAETAECEGMTSFSVGIGGPVANMEDLPSSYAGALNAALEALAGHNGDRCHLFEDTVAKAAEAISQEYITKQRIFMESLSSAPHMAAAAFSSFFHKYFTASFAVCDIRIQRLLSALQYDWYAKSNLAVEFAALKQTASSIDEIEHWLLKTIAEFAEEQQKTRDGHTYLAMQKAISYIDAHYANDISLAFISSFTGVSPTYFCEVFKSITGRTLSRYLLEKRSETAKALLSDSEMKVKDIAERLGYASPFYFSNAFKKATGLSPKEYREKVKKCK